MSPIEVIDQLEMQKKIAYLATLYLHPTIFLNGKTSFELKENLKRPPGAYPKATITITYKHEDATWDRRRHSGPGVYGCFWDRELFYIGTYAGKDADLNTGNVARERWCKHIEGMTFRSRRLGIAPSQLRLIGEHCWSPLAKLLGQGNYMNLTKKGGNGNQVQYNKFLFADRHWKDFSVLAQSMMERFDFVYVRPNLNNVFVNMTKEDIDPHLRAVETCAVKQLAPPCNSATKVCLHDVDRSIKQATNIIEKSMLKQINGFLSDCVKYKLAPRSRHQPKRNL
jgi:hypothetical protein